MADDPDEGLWERQRAAQRAPDGLVVRVSGLPTQLAAACDAAGSRRRDPRRARRARPVLDRAAGRGACRAAPRPSGRLRTALAPAPCVVLDAPEAVRAALDPWDRTRDSAQVLMRRVKERFDPTATCNPGVFVGGI